MRMTIRPEPPAAAGPLAALSGPPPTVPLATGGARRYVDLDSAASTRALASVEEAVARASHWYASVHRGAGYVSGVATDLYEWARDEVTDFVGGNAEHVTIFTRNTTEALNLAAATVPLRPGHRVLTTLVEHHANLLPWRRVAQVVQIPPPASPDELLERLEAELRGDGAPIDVVAMSGASNVTGEVFPIAEAVALAHAHGAYFVLDAAQLAPHRPIDLAELGVDLLALSGHKMHAPYGTGALVARRGLLDDAEPLLAGGGAVDLVTDDAVTWTRAPERHEAGTPNVLGAVALGAACHELRRIGMDRVAAHEIALLAELDDGLAAIDAIERYRLWASDGIDRLGLATFNVRGHDHALVAAVLSAEHGIGVRDGCFCAHPYVLRLLRVSERDALAHRVAILSGQRERIPGAVRASVSVTTSSDDVAVLVDALEQLITHGPSLLYTQLPDGSYRPVADPRPRRAPTSILGLAPRGASARGPA